jgi:hypothetical protein
MTISLPPSAFFPPPPSSENNGVDFLGLRQANLDMMAGLIPGTNNVTSYIRPFSLLSWIFWKFHNLCETQRKERPTSDDIRLFRERIEVLFTWGAQLDNTPNIPGKGAKPPSTSGPVALTFNAWGRVQSSTSLIAALWYGPASKTITGLAFLEPLKAEFFRVTRRGAGLAEALDGVLRTNRGLYANLLDTLAPVSAVEDDARALWALWGVLAPTPVEQQVFREAFFDEQRVGDYKTPLGQRSSTIALVQLHLSHSGLALSADQIRRGTFSSARPNGVAYPVPEALKMAWRKWIILQMRQLQRLALESLLSWCEQRILDRIRETAQLTGELEQLFRQESFGINPDTPIFAIVGQLNEKIQCLDEFVLRGQTDWLFSPFAIIDEIHKDFKAHSNRFAAVSMYALVLCASFAGCFGDAEKSMVTVGGPSRLSLFHLRKRLSALGDVSLKQAIRFVLESMVLSQHFATAVNRFDGQNQRLRLAIEEEGLISLAGKPWEPTVTEDRLATLLKLAADCGLIAKTGEAFQF